MNILKLLKNKDTREDIIENFEEFIVSDDDLQILHNYIDYNLMSYLYIEDSYELSILSNYVTKLHYVVASQVLSKRNSYLLKLSVLDFLLMSISEKDKNLGEFIGANQTAYDDNNVFVSFQAKLNLLCADSESLEYFLDSRIYTYPALFYRLVNSLENSIILKSIFSSYIDEIKMCIEEKDNISIGQKNELTQRIDSLYKI